jgi:hypothetical protein
MESDQEYISFEFAGKRGGDDGPVTVAYARSLSIDMEKRKSQGKRKRDIKERIARNYIFITFSPHCLWMFFLFSCMLYLSSPY